MSVPQSIQCSDVTLYRGEIVPKGRKVVGYGAMTWDAKKSRWAFSKKNVGAKPATVTVKGREGQWTSVVR